MKANELRIGNLFQGDKFSIARYGMYSDGVTSITGYGIYLLSENDNILDLKPIPLTEEILLKCGFKFKKCGPCGQDQWANLDIWSIPCSDTGNFITIRGSSRNSFILYPYGTYIHSLHQLQNLYFALTGEELIYVV